MEKLRPAIVMATRAAWFAMWAASFAVACGPRAAPPGAGANVPKSSNGSVENWQTSLNRDHPMVGRIWDCKRHNFTDAGSMWKKMRESQIILLGERHDHPDHHRLQATALRAVVEGGRHPAVAFEMFDVGQQPAIDRYLSSRSAGADGLGAATGWEKTGWPPFGLYLPIFQVAFENRLPIVAANLPQTEVRALVHEGVQALGPDLAGLELDRDFPAPLESSLRQELLASHCGQLPESMVGAMALAQHARDAFMARAALAAAQRGEGTVLIAGDGHVRIDRGVPYYLQKQKPGISVVSLAMLEVDPDSSDPASDAKAFGASELPFDFAWFTPRGDQGDPCAGMRKGAK